MLLLAPIFLLMGCTSPENEWTAGDLKSVNHLEGGINWLSVNGYRAPGGGGNTCCILLPTIWRPGMTAKVKWEVDRDPYAYFNWPPHGTDGFRSAAEKHRAKYEHHEAEVEIPYYHKSNRCGLTVHFMVCNEIAVTTSCWEVGHQNYPIKVTKKTPEPAVCPSPKK